MKRKILLAACVLGALNLLACASNPNKAEKIDTKIEKSDKISGDRELGVKDGNMVVQRKTLMSEELRDLQYEVYSLEDRVYGNTKYGSSGLYGNLKDCKKDLSDKRNGGDGKLMWTEPIDRVTDKEEEFKIGIDENDKVVGVSEEFLKDRLKRFRDYKRTLVKRQEEYQDKLDICKAEVKSRKHDQNKKSADADAGAE
jgi:hypothetical protein